jgi:hypothetical protein
MYKKTFLSQKETTRNQPERTKSFHHLLTSLHLNVAVTAVSSRSDVGADVRDTRGVLDVLSSH